MTPKERDPVDINSGPSCAVDQETLRAAAHAPRLGRRDWSKAKIVAHFWEAGTERPPCMGTSMSRTKTCHSCSLLSLSFLSFCSAPSGADPFAPTGRASDGRRAQAVKGGRRGVRFARSISARCGFGAIAPTTPAATGSCRSNVSSSAPSKRSAQRCTPVPASMSCPEIRRRFPALRTPPYGT
jgi:hypothetical protein